MSASPKTATAHVRVWLENLAMEHPHIHARLTDPHDPQSVVVGLSGGADSLALTHAAVRAGLNTHAVIVDHQLQDGSRAIAERAAAQAEQVGATAEIVTVNVEGAGEGPARHARYRALGQAASGRGVLVAHTATDDAEGFLVSLARGSGVDTLAGMRPLAFAHPAVQAGASWLGRPLLHATRQDTERDCAHAGLNYWQDPHNFSADYLRSRVRQDLMPHLVDVLGSAVTDNLARSARLLRDDATALNSLAESTLKDVTVSGEGEELASERTTKLDCTILSEQLPAIRRRVYRLWLAEHAGPLNSVHIEGIDALVIAWRGQGPVAVPWPPHWHTMNEARRTTQRLVVRRRSKHLQLDVMNT